MIQIHLVGVSLACTPNCTAMSTKRINMKALRLVRMFVLVFAIPLFGCTATHSPSASGMKAVSFPEKQHTQESPYYQKIAVGSISIEATGRDQYTEIVLEEKEFQQALEDSLATAHLLANESPDKARYILNAAVIETPLGAESGMLTLTTYIAYEVVDSKNGTVPFRETIAGWDRAWFGKRATFHEVAFRKNIERLLTKLAAAPSVTEK